MAEVVISVTYNDNVSEFVPVIETTIKIPPSATEGEILDTISRSTCEAYIVAKLRAKGLDTCPTK